MKVATKKIDALIPHPDNVRQGDVGAIVESLKVHGQYRPIVVQKSTQHILSGNHTWKAAKALGWDTIEVVEIDVDDAQAKRILLVDNRATDLATYDDRALASLLKQLAETEGSLEGTGFDGDDLDDLLFRIDRNSLGTISEGLRPDEVEENYLAKAIRSIILPFQNQEYESVVAMAEKTRRELGIDNNSDLFKALLEQVQ
jgi:ParB-like chromosome segregation protein Spo0J